MTEEAPMLQGSETELITQLRADSEPLRASFASAAAYPQAFAEAFYARLFELAPGARALFPAQLQPQQEKFAQTIATIVGFLDDPTALVTGLRQLGARHVAYGTLPIHYAVVGEALLHTLEQRCGGLDSKARLAWRRLYGWVVAEMLTGARAA